MMKLGRVSKETKGIPVEGKVEDKILCLAGSNYFRQGSGCPAG